jgi:hypothetical protein
MTRGTRGSDGVRSTLEVVSIIGAAPCTPLASSSGLTHEEPATPQWETKGQIEVDCNRMPSDGKVLGLRCRCKMRMSGLSKGEMSAFRGARRSHETARIALSQRERDQLRVLHD